MRCLPQVATRASEDVGDGEPGEALPFGMERGSGSSKWTEAIKLQLNLSACGSVWMRCGRVHTCRS